MTKQEKQYIQMVEQYNADRLADANDLLDLLLKELFGIKK